MGFTTVVLIQIFHSKGILFSLVSIVPQMIILMPALLIYSVFNINFAVSLRKVRGRGQTLHERKDMLLQNLVALMSVTVILVLCSLIDTFVVPPILKPICSYMTY